MERHDKQEIETGFREESIEKAARDIRIATIAAAVLFPLFTILDAVIYPDLIRAFILIRAAVVLGSIAIFVIVGTGAGHRHARGYGIVAYLIWTCSIVAMVHLTGGYASPYYAGINLVLITFLFILPLDVGRTAFVCGVVYLSYLIPMFFASPISSHTTFLNNHFFLVATMILVIMSSYLSTKMRLKEFTARFRLARANEELKELDILKSQFFANISHEVRTPLTSIIAPVQSMFQGDAGRLTDEQQTLVGQVYRNSVRLLDMINQMLDFAKFDARKMQLRLARVSVAEIVRDVVTVFTEVSARKGLALSYKVLEEVPTVYLDREKMDRILSNLIRNAIKFTDSGSVSVTIGRNATAIVIKITDTGIGIPDDHLKRIFERFQQVDGSSTRRFEGTGLGLTIVKEAVELQHGTIAVESTVGRGAEFTIQLPLDLETRAPDAFIERRGRDRRNADRPFTGPDRRQGPRRGAETARVSVEDLAFADAGDKTGNSITTRSPATADGLDVLYAEDNEDLRTFVSTMLAKFGHRITTAVDGQEGWERVLRLPPDVIVSDVMMPRMDGYEFLIAVKSTDETRHIPFILITAKSELDSKIEGLEFGADDYLPKPINIRELEARVRNLVTGRRLHEAALQTRELEGRIQELSLSFSRSLELRDHYTAGHSNDVLAYGIIIAEELGLPIDARLRESLLLHDIGKLGIPDRILLKPDALTPDEWATMKKHAEIGAELLRDFESFREVADIILAHQERYDGTGYPRGLSGDSIPMIARIIAVADAWHAMTEDRPYRAALPFDEAILELLRNRGRQFDPGVVDALFSGLVSQGILTHHDVNKARCIMN